LNVDGGPKLSHYGELRLHEGVKVAKHEEVLKNMFSDANPNVCGSDSTPAKMSDIDFDIEYVIRESSIW
jgi:hypothetical protein